MDFVDVDSSNVKRVGYSDDNELLVVEYKNNTTYQYYNVPRGIYDSLITATSKGSFISQHIKGKFEFKKIR